MELKKKSAQKPKKTGKTNLQKDKNITWTLSRDRYDGKEGVVGMLKNGSKFLAYTLELEWRNNQRRKSCIPKGTYEIVYRDFGGYYNRYNERFDDHKKGVLELQNVKDRSDILIHIGNRPKDTLGCILVGSEADTNKSIIYDSKKAYIKVYAAAKKVLDAGKKLYIKIV
jgi:hypothetical protein